jgi:hypothetical protein
VAGLRKDLLEPAGWRAAALPNPFIFSDPDQTSEPDADLIFAIALNEAIALTPPAVALVADQPKPSPLQTSPRRSLRGVALLGAVFDELSAQLGKEFSTAELMGAAQLLIDVSKAEYVANPYKDPVERAGYFSWDLVRAFANAWHVADVETYRMEHCDLDELSAETLDCARHLQQGWQEPAWEF